MRFIAVIDVGKTNAKVAIVDSHHWCETVVRTTPNTVLHNGLYPHFDIDNIWRFITVSIKELNCEFPIDAISISTHGACGVLLDADGNLAMPVLDYEHDGPDELAAEYDLVRPDFAETGSPRLQKGLNLGAQIYWQMTRFPEQAKHVDKILTYAQYWAYRLTGVASNETTSLGCHTDLWNPWEGIFSSLVMDQDWLSLMADVHKAEETLGTVTSSFAAETGLAKTVSVTCGIHDSNASLYPHLVSHEAPFSVVSSGTWTISMAVGGDSSVTPNEARDTLINVNAFGKPVPSARFMGGREFDILMAGRSSKYTAADRKNIIDQMTMITPSVEPSFGPFQGRKMAWHGTAPSNDGEHYVAVSFYLALMTVTCLELTGAQGPTIVEGPFANNELYCEMVAAATKRSIIISNGSATGTGIGASMLVQRSKELHRAPDLALDEIVDLDRSRALFAYFEKWKKLLY